MPKQSHRKSGKPKSEFQERVVKIDRVNRVVSGGRRMRFRATVVVGNMKGKVGVGLGKADEVATAVRKAVTRAKRNVVEVKLEHGTIPHQVNHKFKSSQVLLFPANQGTGIIAGGAVRTVLELAGVKDVLSKTHGSRHKVNSSIATIEALEQLQIFREPPKAVKKPIVDKKKSVSDKKTDKKHPHTSHAQKKEAPKKEADKKDVPKKEAPKKTDEKSESKDSEKSESKASKEKKEATTKKPTPKVKKKESNDNKE